MEEVDALFAFIFRFINNLTSTSTRLTFKEQIMKITGDSKIPLRGAVKFLFLLHEKAVSKFDASYRHSKFRDIQNSCQAHRFLKRLKIVGFITLHLNWTIHLYDALFLRFVPGIIK